MAGQKIIPIDKSAQQVLTQLERPVTEKLPVGLKELTKLLEGEGVQIRHAVGNNEILLKSDPIGVVVGPNGKATVVAFWVEE